MDRIYVTPRFIVVYALLTTLLLGLAAGVLWFSHLMEATCS